MTTLYTIARDRANRITEARLERARKACKEAGLDSGLLGIHPHNAMIDYEAGRPWKGIDYSKVRLCVRLLEMSYQPNRILDRWSKRMTREHNPMFIHTELTTCPQCGHSHNNDYCPNCSFGYS